MATTTEGRCPECLGWVSVEDGLLDIHRVKGKMCLGTDEVPTATRRQTTSDPPKKKPAPTHPGAGLLADPPPRKPGRPSGTATKPRAKRQPAVTVPPATPAEPWTPPPPPAFREGEPACPVCRRQNQPGKSQFITPKTLEGVYRVGFHLDLRGDDAEPCEGNDATIPLEVDAESSGEDDPASTTPTRPVVQWSGDGASPGEVLIQQLEDDPWEEYRTKYGSGRPSGKSRRKN